MKLASLLVLSAGTLSTIVSGEAVLRGIIESYFDKASPPRRDIHELTKDLTGERKYFSRNGWKCCVTDYIKSKDEGGKTECKNDVDCPSSYCMSGKMKKQPYHCHACGPNCCNSDSDCHGSYCMNSGGTKSAPFTCHAAEPNPTTYTWDESCNEETEEHQPYKKEPCV